MSLTRVSRRSSLEFQFFDSPDAAVPVIISRLPFSRTHDVTAEILGKLIQWSPPNNPSGAAYEYSLFDSGVFVVSGNPLPLEEDPTELIFPDPPTQDLAALRFIEFIAEETQEWNTAVASVSNLVLTVEFTLPGGSLQAFVIPLKLSHAGDCAQFRWDPPAGAVFSSATLAATHMNNLRCTFNVASY